MKQRVLVCGGRDYANAEYMALLLDHAHMQNPITALIHGGAKGADTLAGEWADKNGVPTEVYLANWARDGKSAGPLRNLRMLMEGKPDLVVAFPGGKGTAHMRKVATAHGVHVVTVKI